MKNLLITLGTIVSAAELALILYMFCDHYTPEVGIATLIGLLLTIFFLLLYMIMEKKEKTKRSRRRRSRRRRPIRCHNILLDICNN